jgi:hypothetical protein
MSITVTGHQLGLFGNRRLVHEAENIARQAERIITANVGPLPAVALTLTNERAMAQLATAADAAFAPGASRMTRAVKGHQARRNARGAYGITVLNPAGGISVIVSATTATTGRDLAETILHELVHAVQLGSPDARELHIRHLRHCYRIEPWSRRESADYDRLVDQREAEAHALETLAAQITV